MPTRAPPFVAPVSKYDFYTVATAFGRVDADTFATEISHAQVVDWLAFRDERTARGNALWADGHKTLPSFT